MRRAVLAGTTLVFALLGTRLSAPHDRKAGEPFVYAPPEGFSADKIDPAKAVVEEGAAERQWTHPPKTALGIEPRVHLSLSKTGGTVEGPDLARIAEGMPAMLEASGVTWTDVRRETRTRPDGARVGLIEGECTKKVETMIVGGPTAKVRYRRLLLVFPTDDGSALLTAVYGKEDSADFQAAFEASVDKARGVAVRVPSPPGWMYLAWGGAGLLIGWLALSLLTRREARGGGAAVSSSTKDEHA